MKSRINVVCIIEHDGRILLGRKAPGIGPYPGNWLIPGGGVDTENESLDDAMRREMLEETNLSVTEFTRLSFNEDIAKRHGEITRLFFLYYKITGVEDWSVMMPGDDLVELRWFEFARLARIQIPQVSKTLFKDLGYPGDWD